MKKHILLCTNITVCAIISLGFILTAMIGYYSNTGSFEKDAEHVSALAAEGIYYQIDKILSEPINVSMTMANDSLLKSVLDKEEQEINNTAYMDHLQEFLSAYREKYAYDSVFLISRQTNRYYHFNGVDRVITRENPENIWYYDFLESNDEYSLNIDNDEAGGNSITAFVNCKIKDKNGEVTAVIGVGLKVASLQSLLKEYNRNYNVTACLVDNEGVIQLSSDQSGFEGVNLFEKAALVDYKNSILSNQAEQKTFWYTSQKSKCYVVSQYIDNLKWHIVVENDMTTIARQLQMQFYKSILIMVLILLFVLLSITKMLKHYKNQIINLGISQKYDYQRLLNQAMEGLYDNLFEIDITHNRVYGENAGEFFESLGISKKTAYDKVLYAIAGRQVKEEYAQGYLDTFSPENIIKSYQNGINTLTYDFMISKDDGNYKWIRLTGRIFFWTSDESIRMISYRENIDEKKRRELHLLEKSQYDTLTGLYNKGTFEDAVFALLDQGSKTDSKYAFLLFDLDDFKNINDRYGHAFGDTVLKEFAFELKNQFRDCDIVGRVGGDEFAQLCNRWRCKICINRLIKASLL